MFQQITVNTNKIYQLNFLKVIVLSCSTKAAISRSFFRAPCSLSSMIKKLTKTERFNQAAVSKKKVHLEDFLRVAALNRSTKGAMTNSFRR